MRLWPIDRVLVRPLGSTLHMPFHISHGSVETLENVLIVLRDAEGRSAVGEAAPFPVLTGDTQQTVLPACQQLADALVGLHPAAAMTRLHDELWNDFAKTPTARAGVELALWDLYARQLGVSLSSLWGRAARLDAETDITLPRLSADEVLPFYRHFSSHRFPFVKVKVGGGALSEDLDRVMALVRCAGPSVRLSLDGNQGLCEQSAAMLCDELSKWNVTPLFFEQPLPYDDIAGMARLSQRLRIPICADESVKTIFDAMTVMERRAAQMVNLKFMKSGVRESLLIAELARRTQTELMIGGMVESEIAMTASLHAVCGTGLISVCDLDTPFFLRDRFTVDSPYHRSSAKLVLPSGTGLGLSLRDELLG
mgnify:CR=1 FL=1